MAADAKSVRSLLDRIHWISAELKRRASQDPEEQKLLLATRGVLQTLAENGEMSVPAVAMRRNTTRQNIQIIANRLAGHGLVEFIPNPRHKKSDLLRLTQKGAALLASAGEQEAAFLENLAAQLPKPEVDSAVSCLSYLRSVLSSTGMAQASAQPHRPKRPARAFPVQSPAASPLPSAPQPTALSTPKPYSEEESLPINLL